MFGKPQIDLTQIRATSKLSLKMSCLAACGNDVDKAEKLYRFIAEDLSNLPDIDPAKASVVEQIKQVQTICSDGSASIKAISSKGGISSK